MIRLELRSLSTALLRIASGSNHSASEHYQESCYCSSMHYQHTLYVYFALHHLHQLNETFLVELFNQDGSKQLIEEPSSVNLTITENDDPHGVFSFVAESLNVAIGEFRDLLVYPDSTSCCWSDLINCCTMGPIRVYLTVCVPYPIHCWYVSGLLNGLMLYLSCTIIRCIIAAALYVYFDALSFIYNR